MWVHLGISIEYLNYSNWIVEWWIPLPYDKHPWNGPKCDFTPYSTSLWFLEVFFNGKGPPLVGLEAQNDAEVSVSRMLVQWCYLYDVWDFPGFQLFYPNVNTTYMMYIYIMYKMYMIYHMNLMNIIYNI